MSVSLHRTLGRILSFSSSKTSSLLSNASANSSLASSTQLELLLQNHLNIFKLLFATSSPKSSRFRFILDVFLFWLHLVALVYNLLLFPLEHTVIQPDSLSTSFCLVILCTGFLLNRNIFNAIKVSF